MSSTSRLTATAFAAAAAAALAFAVPAAASPPGGLGGNGNGGVGGGTSKQLMYSAVPSPLPGNLPSLGFEATQTSEFGDAITLAPGTGRGLKSVTVTMSSWGCEDGSGTSCVTTPGATFAVPITFTIYGTDATTVLAQRTQTFAVPYRPSADPACASPSQWKNGAGDCFNGLATNIAFSFRDVTVPDQLVYGIAYNTTTAGAAPIGGSAACVTESGGCGYDSLNVGLASAAFIGTQTYPGSVYWNTNYGPFYADGGAGGVGTFRLDTGWEGYVPAVQFSKVPVR